MNHPRLNAATWLFIIITCTLNMLSCGNGKLDREKSAELLQSFYGYPTIFVFHSPYHIHGETYSIDKETAQLKSQGLLKKTREFNTAYDFTLEGNRYHLDQNGSVATGTLEFVEVTGIKFTNDAESAAEVNYTLRAKDLTPFAILSKIRDGQSYPYTAKFEKFDDGWRVMDSKQGIYHPDAIDPPLPAGTTEPTPIPYECSHTVEGVEVSILGDNVRIRSSRDSQSKVNILTTANKGTKMAYVHKSIDKNGDWWYGVCYNNIFGYVHSQFAQSYRVESSNSSEENEVLDMEAEDDYGGD